MISLALIYPICLPLSINTNDSGGCERLKIIGRKLSISMTFDLAHLLLSHFTA